MIFAGDELPGDAPVSLGADHFCALCRKCADNCPSGALATGGKERLRGLSKWPTHVERCYGYWRVTGTDSGVCMKDSELQSHHGRAVLEGGVRDAGGADLPYTEVSSRLQRVAGRARLPD